MKRNQNRRLTTICKIEILDNPSSFEASLKIPRKVVLFSSDKFEQAKQIKINKVPVCKLKRGF